MGSAHTDVPVNPREPKDCSLKWLPLELLPDETVSQPSAHVLLGAMLARVVNCGMLRLGKMPAPSHARRHFARSCAVENRPAWEAIPPIAAAFSSWTSPCTR